jgi:hypothetical protein
LDRDVSRSRHKGAGKVSSKASRAVKLHDERAKNMVVYLKTRNNFKKKNLIVTIRSSNDTEASNQVVIGLSYANCVFHHSRCGVQNFTLL